MNSKTFVNLVQSNGNYSTQVKAKAAIAAFTAAITQALTAGEDVQLTGFGTFKSVLRKGKSGTIPGTNKIYSTQNKQVPKFSAGKHLKLSVAG